MNIFKYSLKYLSKYKWLTIGAFIAMLLMTLASLMIPSYIQTIIDDGITAKNIDVIKTVTITLIIIAVIEAISSFCKSYWSEKTSQGIAFDIRNQLYAKLENLEFSFHDKYPIGQLLTRATSDVEAVRNFYASAFLQLLSAIITLVGAMSILFYTNVSLTAIVLLVVPFILYVFFRLFKNLGPFFGRVQQSLGKLNNVLQENIEGIRVVKSFTAEKYELLRYKNQNQKLFDENLNVIKIFSTNFPVVFFLTNITTVIAIWLGGSKVINEQMTLGQLIAFNSYLTYLIQPIFQLGMISQQMSRATASNKRIFEILDKESIIHSKKDAIKVSPDQKFEIEYHNVSFKYSESSKDIISNINLKIPFGSTLAILGSTGSGKSTLTNLIPRFYDPTEGYLTVDGINLKEYDVDSLRKNIGIVLQDVRLLHSTIRENISFGKPEATDAEIREVCRIAQIEEFIDQLPEGLDYVIGEGGGNISGGQRQRIAIARMLLINPKVLILDDATSALDAETEFEFRQALQSYIKSQNHTAIIISQKISSITEADKIILLQDGKILDQGKHKDLMRCSSEYRKIYESQNQTYGL